MSSHKGPGLLGGAGVAVGLAGAGLTMTGYQNAPLGWLLVVVGVLLLASAVIWFCRSTHKPLQLTVLSDPDEQDDWYVKVLNQGSAGRPRWTFVLMLRIRLSNPNAHPVEISGISAELLRGRRWPRRKLPANCTERKITDGGGGPIKLPHSVAGGGHSDLYIDFECLLHEKQRLSRATHGVRLQVDTPAGKASAIVPPDFLPD